MWSCPRCHAQNPDTRSICLKCGKKVLYLKKLKFADDRTTRLEGEGPAVPAAGLRRVRRPEDYQGSDFNYRLLEMGVGSVAVLGISAALVLAGWVSLRFEADPWIYVAVFFPVAALIVLGLAMHQLLLGLAQNAEAMKNLLQYQVDVLRDEREDRT